MALQTPLSWIQDFVELSMSPEDMAERMTTAGLEVELIEKLGEDWGDYCVVGQIVGIEKHPNADSLSLVKVEFAADEPITLVTGAPNIRELEGNIPAPAPKVALALSGAMLVDAYSDDRPLKKLKPSKIRGIASEGMLCSELELGLSEEHEGIMILPVDAPVGTLLQDYMGDTILHFDIKGGFSHLLSMLGMARETAALTEKPLDKTIFPDVNSLEIVEQPAFINLEIADPDICTRYTALLIRNVKIGPSPFWMQQRLLRIGMRPINNIVDITNYVMFELGQPLHAFDYDKLIERANGGTPKIIVRRAKFGEKLLTLDEVERELDEQMLMITDTAGLIAIAGVMGGGDSEVTENTTNILLESANFEFLNNRRTAQVLKLRTEASERFGKQVDPDGCLKAGLRAAQLMVEHGGGELEKTAGDLYPTPLQKITIDLDPKYVDRLLGIQIPLKKITKILESLEFIVSGTDILKVKVPSHRMDVRIPADLVEEIVRVYGYNNLPTTLLADELPPQHSNPRLEGTENLRDILVTCGLDEIITYSMMDPMDEGRLHLNDSVDLDEFVPLKNPLSQERSHLRRSLLPGALMTARANLRYLDKVVTFEVGSVFHPKEDQLLPDEPQRLSILMTGTRTLPAWMDKDLEQLQSKFDFFDIKGILEQLFQALHIKVEWKKNRDLPCHPGRSAQMLIHDSVLGFVGELHPKIREKFSLPDQAICIAELDLDQLLKLSLANHQMDGISTFTPIFEDLAFLLDKKIPVGEITPLILQTGKPLLKNVTLFDVYEGEQIEAGKRSLAYSLTFQSNDRTLTDKEVGKVRNKIIKRVQHELQATLRTQS